MPSENKTGPWGLGPRTGRGLGNCRGNSSLNYARGRGMGYGRRYGGGRGWGRGGWSRGRRFYLESNYQDPMTNIPVRNISLKPEEEESYLEETLIGLKKDIESIEKRLGELQENQKE